MPQLPCTMLQVCKLIIAARTLRVDQERMVSCSPVVCKAASEMKAKNDGRHTDTIH